MKRISIHDIAKELKVSSATISYVLNGKAEERKISTLMRDKILAYAAEIGYKPNIIAQSLRTGKTRLIAVLVEDISDPFFSEICRSIEECAFKQDYKVFCASTENDPEKTRVQIDIFKNLNVDGFIIVPPIGIEDELNKLMSQNYPLVLIDRYYKELKTTNIVVDNYGGAAMAVDKMISGGCKRMGFITLDSEQTQMADRLSGYEDKLREHSMEHFIQKIDFNEEQNTIAGQMAAFISKNELDSILFGTNYLTAGGLKALQQLNLTFPKDVALISFDDHPFYALFSTPITAIAQPVSEIAAIASVRLINIISGKNTTPETIVLPVALIARESA